MMIWPGYLEESWEKSSLPEGVLQQVPSAFAGGAIATGALRSRSVALRAAFSLSDTSWLVGRPSPLQVNTSGLRMHAGCRFSGNIRICQAIFPHAIAARERCQAFNLWARF
jgi:hypothetical protein